MMIWKDTDGTSPAPCLYSDGLKGWNACEQAEAKQTQRNRCVYDDWSEYDCKYDGKSQYHCIYQDRTDALLPFSMFQEIWRDLL